MDKVPIPIPPVEQLYASQVNGPHKVAVHVSLTNGTADDKHGICHRSCLDCTADQEPNEPHEHRIFSRKFIGQKPCLRSTQQRPELQHGGHQPFPKACRRISACIDPRKHVVEVIHSQRDRYHALVVAYININRKSTQMLVEGKMYQTRSHPSRQRPRILQRSPIEAIPSIPTGRTISQGPPDSLRVSLPEPLHRECEAAPTA